MGHFFTCTVNLWRYSRLQIQFSARSRLVGVVCVHSTNVSSSSKDIDSLPSTLFGVGGCHRFQSRGWAQSSRAQLHWKGFKSTRGSWGYHLGSVSGVLDPFRGLQRAPKPKTRPILGNILTYFDLPWPPLPTRSNFFGSKWLVHVSHI